MGLNIKSFIMNSAGNINPLGNNRTSQTKVKNTQCEGDTFVSSNTTGKHNIPKYIRHITTVENLKKMQKKGYILPEKCGDDPAGEGIFATELTNLFKYWSKVKGDLYDDNILEKLLTKIGRASKNSKIVVLTIPTSKLDPDYLYVRSQNAYFASMNSMPESSGFDCFIKLIKNDKESKLLENYHGNKDDSESIYRYLSQNGYLEHQDGNYINPEIRNKWAQAQADWQNNINQKRTALEKNADLVPAVQSKLFEQKGHAIEYIYKKPIPMNIVEISNPADTSELIKISDNEGNTSNAIIDIARHLFKGKPEEKAVEECLINQLA